jgi:site-specific DNA-methyltransferase (adenine-specific)
MTRCELVNGCGLELLESLPAGSADLVLSDQPYNTTYLAFDRQAIDYDRLFAASWRALKPSGWLILFGRGKFVASLMARDEFLYERVWLKSRKTGGHNSRFRPLLQHEWIFHFNRDASGGVYNPQSSTGHKPKGVVKRGSACSYSRDDAPSYYEETEGERLPTTQMRYDDAALDYPNPTRGRDTHPTGKPIGLLLELVRTHTNEGELVVDPFNGGDETRASTAEAAYLAGRNFVGAELVPSTFEAAQRRLNALTNAPVLFSV